MLGSIKAVASVSAIVALVGLAAVGRHTANLDSHKSVAKIADVSRLATRKAIPAVGTTSAVNRRDMPSMPVATFGFHPYTSYELDYALPSAVAIGDVSGDGRDDVVVAGYGTGLLSVYLQSKEGALLAPRLTGFPTGYVNSIALTDLDSDGAKDIVVGLQGDLGILLHTETGFLPRTYQTSIDPMSLVVLDLDSDGDMDLVGQSSSGGAVLFYGDGQGAIAQQVPLPTPAYDRSDLKVGDVTGDGKLDLVLTDTWGFEFWVYPGNGEGAFDSAVAYSYGDGPDPWGTAIGDFNGDGKNDVVIPEYFSNGLIHIYPQGGNGLLGSPVTIQSAPQPRFVASADLDRNGLDDLVAVHENGATGYFLQTVSGMGTEILISGGGSPTHFDPETLAVGDINSDGYPDILVSTLYGLRVFRARGPNCRTGKPTVCPPMN